MHERSSRVSARATTQTINTASPSQASDQCAHYRHRNEEQHEEQRRTMSHPRVSIRKEADTFSQRESDRPDRNDKHCRRKILTHSVRSSITAIQIRTSSRKANAGNILAGQYARANGCARKYSNRPGYGITQYKATASVPIRSKTLVADHIRAFIHIFPVPKPRCHQLSILQPELLSAASLQASPFTVGWRASQWLQGVARNNVLRRLPVR